MEQETMHRMLFTAYVHDSGIEPLDALRPPPPLRLCLRIFRVLHWLKNPYFNMSSLVGMRESRDLMTVEMWWSRTHGASIATLVIPLRFFSNCWGGSPPWSRHLYVQSLLRLSINKHQLRPSIWGMSCSCHELCRNTLFSLLDKNEVYVEGAIALLQFVYNLFCEWCIVFGFGSWIPSYSSQRQGHSLLQSSGHSCQSLDCSLSWRSVSPVEMVWKTGGGQKSHQRIQIGRCVAWFL